MSDAEEPRPRTDYRVSLDALEASARIPEESQVSEQAEPAPPDLVGPDEMARLSMLRLGGAGV